MTKKRGISKDTRIAYFGTSEFAVHVFDELIQAGITPVLLVTTPDKPAGRGLALTESPAKKWAAENDIAALQPKSLSRTDPDMAIIFNSEWDLFVVASYGKILPLEVLKLPDAGTLNVHPSLLPRYRGPSPIESQIIADDRETGVSIILLDEEMDHGPVVAQASITPEEWPIRYSVLEELLGSEGGKLLAEIVSTFIDERNIDSESWEYGIEPTLKPEPQDHEKATFTQKIRKEDGLINLSNDAFENYLKFCAYDVWPGAFFMHQSGGKSLRVKVTDARYENGAFTPTRVIPEGRKEMDFESFKRGFPTRTD